MSGKSLFVMDETENCVDCQFCYEHDEGIEACCIITRYPDNDGTYREMEKDYCQIKPNWCPLKPMPEKRKGTDYLGAIFQNPAFDYGWNACIDEILGGHDGKTNTDET